MKQIKVGINGFGRIGRAYLKLALENKDIDVVAINDLMDVEHAAYLLKYDTNYGVYDKKIEVSENNLLIDGKQIAFLSKKEIGEIPWRVFDIDVVIESTGIFNTYQKAHEHIPSGAKKVIITAPVKDKPLDNLNAGTVLIGVNTKKAKTCDITSNASCTTNAVGIPLSIFENSIGVESAILNTIHSYTSTQNITDNISRKKSNLRLGRAGAKNIIPSTTGAAIATTKVIDTLKNKFDGISLRVPVSVGSIVDLTFVSKKVTTVDEVNKILKENESELFKVTNEMIVSSDIVGKPYVSIADLQMTRVVNGTLIKVLFWYDNEVGYCASLIEHTKSI